MTKKQNPAQGSKAQTQSRPIHVSFSHGTLHFENAIEARKAMGWFTFHNRVVAQVLSHDIENNCNDLDRLTSLGYLSREMAELICAIEIEIGGAA